MEGPTSLLSGTQKDAALKTVPYQTSLEQTYQVVCGVRLWEAYRLSFLSLAWELRVQVDGRQQVALKWGLQGRLPSQPDFRDASCNIRVKGEQIRQGVITKKIDPEFQQLKTLTLKASCISRDQESKEHCLEDRRQRVKVTAWIQRHLSLSTSIDWQKMHEYFQRRSRRG